MMTLNPLDADRPGRLEVTALRAVLLGGAACMAVALVLLAVQSGLTSGPAPAGKGQPGPLRPIESDYDRDRSRDIFGVVESEGEEPVPGATVRLIDVGALLPRLDEVVASWPRHLSDPESLKFPFEQQTTSDEVGRFVFEKPTTGLKMLTVSAPEHPWARTARFVVLDGVPQSHQRIVLSPEVLLRAEWQRAPGEDPAALRAAWILPAVPALPQRWNEALKGGKHVVPGVGTDAPTSFLFRGVDRSHVATIHVLKRPAGDPRGPGEKATRSELPLGPGSKLILEAACSKECPDLAPEGCTHVRIQADVRELDGKGATQPEAGERRSAVGLLVDEASKAPIAGARVELFRGSPGWDPFEMIASGPALLRELSRIRHVGASTANGEFFLERIDPNSGMSVRVVTPLRTWWAPLPGISGKGGGSPARLETPVMARPTGRIRISALIRPHESVRIQDPDGATVFAGVFSSEGSVTTPPLPSGRYLVQGMDGIFEYRCKGVNLAAGATISLTLVGTDLRAESDVLPYLMGFVSDDRGTPMKKLEIVAQSARGPGSFIARAETDEQGFYRINTIPLHEPLVVGVMKSKLGAHAVQRFSRVTMGSRPDPVYRELLVDTREIRLRLQDSDGAPWTGACVLQMEGDAADFILGPMSPDPRGTVVVSNLPAGEYAIQPSTAGRNSSGSSRMTRFRIPAGPISGEIPVRIEGRQP